MPPSSEDVSPTLARAVLPTYLHHVMDASETLADFALRRLAGNETARRELKAQIDAQREVCAAPVSVLKGRPDSAGGPFARSEALSPGARAARRAADDAKLADLERALRAANAEAGEIEVRLRVAEDAASSLRGAPRELRAVSRLLGDVIADLEACDDDDDDDCGGGGGGAFSPRAPRSAGSASSGRSGASAAPGSQEAIATAAAILADAERVEPSVPMVTGARVTAVARAAADAADALLSRAQQCLEEEAKLRGLLERAREARRVNADPAKPARSPSFFRDPAERARSARSPDAPLASPSGSSASETSGPVWSPGGRFLGSAAAARQSDATAKAQARRATQRRSLKDARTQKRVQRNLDYHIARLEEETRRMSTEADALEAHLKRVEANHRRAAGVLDTLAWLLEHAEAFRKEAARREAERRRRRERRFAPSGASVRLPARVSVSAGSDALSEASASSRGALGLPMRGGGGDADASSRPASSRPASRSSALERWQARAHAERSNPRAPGGGEEHWREKYARQRDEIVSRESARSATRVAADDADDEPRTDAERERDDDDVSSSREPVSVTRDSHTSRGSDRTDGRPRRVSPLRRHHDRLMERRGTETSAPRGDDRAEGSSEGSQFFGSRTEARGVPVPVPATVPLSVPLSVPVTGQERDCRTRDPEHVESIPMMRLEDLPMAVPVPTATPPVNRVLDLNAPRTEHAERAELGRDPPGNEGGDVGPPPPRPESSLEAIEAELAELRRLEFEATGAVPPAFGFEPEAPGPSPGRAPDETRRKPKPLPTVDLRPKPRAKPREPWGPPPAPPKTKWKRNSLDREAVAALRKETRAREGTKSPTDPAARSGDAVPTGSRRAASPPRASPTASRADARRASSARGGRSPGAPDGVEALAPPPAARAKKRSVFKSAYKSLKRAAGIPSKKDKAAAKAKRDEEARAAAGTGGR